MRKKQQTTFFDRIAEHGLQYEHAKNGHYKITKDGAFICTMSHTGDWNAIKMTARLLVNLGHLPAEAKKWNIA